MKLYGLKTCDTCRKALKTLDGAAFVDVRADGVPGPVLEAALTAFGERILNTRSTTWRNLDAEERAKSDAGVAAIASNADEAPAH